MSNSHYNSPPHFEDPLIAPIPHKVIPDLPANVWPIESHKPNLVSNPYSQQMAQNLDDFTTRYGSPQQYQPVEPGFVFPGPVNRPGSTLPPPAGSDWSPWSPVAQQPQGFDSQYPPLPYPSGTHSPFHPPQNTAPPSPTNSPLTAPLPTIQTLTGAIPSIQDPSFDPARKVVWCRDIFFLVDRLNQSTPESPIGPVHIEDPQLLRLTQIAVPTILAIASPQPPLNPVPPYVAEAIYLRATLESSGAFPEDVPLNPRVAFRDYEQAARAGYPQAWFRLGRDYEGFGDDKHARTCFERGVKASVENCLYVCARYSNAIKSLTNNPTEDGNGASVGSTWTASSTRYRTSAPTTCSYSSYNPSGTTRLCIRSLASWRVLSGGYSSTFLCRRSPSRCFSSTRGSQVSRTCSLPQFLPCPIQTRPCLRIRRTSVPLRCFAQRSILFAGKSTGRD